MPVKKRKDRPSPPGKESAVPLTRKSVWLWVFLVLFFSAWMFGLGILVGRGTAPVRFDIQKLQKELTELKEKSLRAELSQFKIDRNAMEEKPDLSFYEALKATTEELTLPSVPPAEKKEALPKKEAPKTVKDSVPAPAAEPKEDQKPAERKEEKVSVQVASLKDRKDADKLVTILRVKGFPAYRTLSAIPGKGIWFRIRVGPYEKREEALQAMSRLKKEKYTGFVVND